MYYNVNGIPSEEAKETSFWIKEFQNKFIFKDGDITSEIDNELIKLRQKVAELIFGSVQNYYELLYQIPIWISYAGIDEELKISKKQFDQLLSLNNNPDTHKFLYFYDIANLIGTLQNSIQESRYLFCELYKELNVNSFMLQPKPPQPNTVMFASGLNVVNLFSKINHLFISLNSQLDFTTKICFELENIHTNFDTYPKLKSSKTLYGDSKKLSINNSENTLFKENNNIRIIQSLRNEIIHNSSFEGISKIYQVFKNNEMIEKFVFMPDLEDGRIQSTKNRKRFFYNDQKLNEYLPDMMKEFWVLQMNTIKLIESTVVKSVV